MKRRESGKVAVAPLKAKSEAAPRRKSAGKELNSEDWIAWPLIIKAKIPDMTLDRPQFSLFAKTYLHQNGIEQRKFSVPEMAIKSFGIPVDRKEDFLQKFTEKFKFLDEVKAIAESPVIAGSQKHALEAQEDAEESARKMQRRETKKIAIEKSGLLLYNR